MCVCVWGGRPLKKNWNKMEQIMKTLKEADMIINNE